MFIPLRTDRESRRRPVVTQVLIVVNLLVYIAGLAAEYGGVFDREALLNWGAFNPRDFHLHQLVTYQFLHDPHSIWHLAFNMLFLWVFGGAVEGRLGRIGFLLFYLVGGAIAALAQMMVSSAPCIGASGAVAGVAGAFLALFPRSRVYMLGLLFIVGVFNVSSLWFIGFYFLLDFLNQTGALLGINREGVAYMAHLAGYVYGFGIAFLLLATGVLKREEYDVFFLFTQMRRRAAMRAANRGTAAGAWESSSADTGTRLQRIAQRDQRQAVSPDQLRLAEQRAEIHRLLAAHDLPAAAALYRQVLTEAPETVFSDSRQLDLANQLLAEGDHVKAARAYELLLRAYPSFSCVSEARLLLGLIYTRRMRQPEQARKLIEQARPRLLDKAQQALADELLAELAT